VSAPLAPLYAILDVDLTRARGWAPLDLLEVWLDAGVRLVQLRAKSLSFGPMLELADAVVARVRAAGVTIVVNDRADVALLSGADGVHVGQTDLDPGAVRPIVGAGRLIGVSTHDVAQVDAAASLPIDYVAFGPVFTTGSKAQPDPVVGLDSVRQAARRAGALPVVAIGGITLARAGEVFESGAASVAVISDLLTGDPRERAREWVKSLRDLRDLRG
jgi:thiamine-phosphate pyrophosphorylase